MAPPEPTDPGPLPPPGPRELPKGYARKLMLSGNPMGIVGLIFLGVGLLILAIFPTVGIFTGLWLFLLIGGLLGLIFAGLGGTFSAIVYRNGMRKIRPYKDGVLAEGEVLTVRKDFTTTVNGRNPYIVEYFFRRDGQPFEGRCTTWSNLAIDLEKGHPLHILYLVEDPNQSVVYPPL